MNVALEPLGQLSGDGEAWVAEEGAPWFRLKLEVPASGGWLFLAWDASLSDAVSRPVLRLITQAGDEAGSADILLTGTCFGHQQAIIRVPSGTKALHLSPTDRAGPFGFRLNQAHWISTLRAVLQGIPNRPFMALHALGAALIGRPRDFRLLLGEAIATRPFRDYSKWKRQRMRAPEWEGLDALRGKQYPRLRLLCIGELQPVDFPAAVMVERHGLPVWPADAQEQRQLVLAAAEELGDDDLVMLVPEGVELLPAALPALISLAAAHPDIGLFYGDEEIVQRDGSILPRFHTGFDPLSTFESLEDCPSLAIRVGALRRRAERPANQPRAMAVCRPVLSRKAAIQPPACQQDLLRWMAAGWPIHQPDQPDVPVEAAIIIPTRDRLDLLRACIDSLTPTLPDGAEIVIVDNDSAEEATRAYLEAFSQRPGCQVVKVSGPFNFSRLSNIGARASHARMLVFLNNDTTIKTPDWLKTLWSFAIRRDCGAVGARLLYPSGRVQHAGVIMGIGGYAGHVDLNLAGDAEGAFGRARRNHTLMAVTGACLAVERRKFETIDGFDAVNLPVDLNDIDFCLRLTEQGWRSILAADAVLIHHESASRGLAGGEPRYRAEKAYFAARWCQQIRNDPYFHPALSLALTEPALG